jgi:hypothetical protein
MSVPYKGHVFTVVEVVPQFRAVNWADFGAVTPVHLL